MQHILGSVIIVLRSPRYPRQVKCHCAFVKTWHVSKVFSNLAKIEAVPFGGIEEAQS
jgi:hypothetical protein